jgi:hypothetical protein
MSWLKRIFGLEKPANSQEAIAGNANSSDIPPHKVGLDGNFDESGLAKRVVLAFDEDPDVADEDSLWVAQLQSTVVLKGYPQSSRGDRQGSQRGYRGGCLSSNDRLTSLLLHFAHSSRNLKRGDYFMGINLTPIALPRKALKFLANRSSP